MQSAMHFYFILAEGFAHGFHSLENLVEETVIRQTDFELQGEITLEAGYQQRRREGADRGEKKWHSQTTYAVDMRM